MLGSDTARVWTESDEKLAYATRSSTTGEVMDAAFENQILSNLFNEARDSYRKFTDDSPELSPEELNRKFSIPGRLEFKEPTRLRTAADLHSKEAGRAHNDEIISRGKGGAWENIGIFGASMAGSFVDPIEAPLNFLPVTKLKMLSKLEKFSEVSKVGVALKGAVEGSAGALLAEPVRVGLGAYNQGGAVAEEYQYGLEDAALNVALGAAMGTTLHVSGRALTDAFSPADKRVFWRLAQDSIAQGEPVKIDLDLHPKVISEENRIGRTLSDDERIQVAKDEIPESILKETEITPDEVESRFKQKFPESEATPEALDGFKEEAVKEKITQESSSYFDNNKKEIEAESAKRFDRIIEKKVKEASEPVIEKREMNDSEIDKDIDRLTKEIYDGEAKPKKADFDLDGERVNLEQKFKEASKLKNGLKLVSDCLG